MCNSLRLLLGEIANKNAVRRGMMAREIVRFPPLDLRNFVDSKYSLFSGSENGDTDALSSSTGHGRQASIQTTYTNTPTVKYDLPT